MKKMMTLSLAFLFAFLLGTTAFADVAVEPMYTIIFGVPVLIIAVVVIAVALLVRAIKHRKGK